MSEAERVLRDSGQGSLKQSGGHWERELRDRWAELLLGDSSCDDVDTELSDIAELLQEYDPDMTVTDTQVQESYKRFCEKNPQLMEPEKIAAPAAAESKKPLAKSSRKPFERIVALAATLVLMLTLFTVQASGSNLFRTLAEWTASVLRIGTESSGQVSMGENDLTEGEVRIYATPEEMLSDLHIKGELVPTWVPDRFSLEGCEARKTEAGVSCYVVYVTGGSDLALKMWQKPLEDIYLVEKNQKDASRFVTGAVEHYIFYDGESKLEKAVWTRDNLECRIIGDVSQEEMERIVESIYEGGSK
jgi:hypothetical protein